MEEANALRWPEFVAPRRYRDLSGPLNRQGEAPAFADCIKFLVAAGVIPAEREERWDGFRELRNGFAPQLPDAATPGQTLHALEVVAEQVTALFAF